MVTHKESLKLAARFEENQSYYAANVVRDLASQVDSLQADAERYRWLRNEASKPTPKISVGIWGINGNSHAGKCDATPHEIDAAIDEARKQS